MKNLKTRPKFALINVRLLILIYLLLTLLTILFSRIFIFDLLENGEVPEPLSLALFFIIPAALLILLIYSGMDIVRNYLTHASGSHFQIRLLAYFFVVVILAATPVTLITSLTVSELLRFWRTIDVDTAMSEAQRFAMDSYSQKLEKFEIIVETGSVSPSNASDLPQEIKGVQDFRLVNGNWSDSEFLGDENTKLIAVPAGQKGFAPRELPRDIDVIRYVTIPEPNLIRIYTLDLGENFDASLRTIENENERFGIINSLRLNIRRLLIFYYGVFFLPALLMTLIIALSFTRKVAYPIEELTDATRRVAEGDLSMQILPRKGDEFALLIQAFNAMVRDLEKSRSALLDTEKMNIWQDLAQRLAHEIKNPLTPIRLSAERVLRRWKNDPEKISEILENSMMAIIQETESLSTLLSDFRTLSRPMASSDSYTGLYDLAAELIGSYKSSHPGLRFETENLGREISIKIDRFRLYQILTNLIINSIDAMNGAGLIEIRSDLVKKEGESFCRMSIRDTGKGISKQDAKSVFTPYFTTKESGTGLGLPIIERIVHDHRGAIWFDSGGTGTTFYVDLPLEKDT
ncbi:MAG: HAMP domain-containing protein [Treponema sp.]|jgi:nitrogen fixation/metabolism regulation signal transduction histidine kinase|nr:HAMP domain-containing protein [Treponema sp.]